MTQIIVKFKSYGNVSVKTFADQKKAVNNAITQTRLHQQIYNGLKLSNSEIRKDIEVIENI